MKSKRNPPIRPSQPDEPAITGPETAGAPSEGLPVSWQIPSSASGAAAQQGITAAPQNEAAAPQGVPAVPESPAAHGLRRVPASEVPAPRRQPRRAAPSLRSRAGAIPGRSSRDEQFTELGPGTGGPAGPGGHGGNGRPAGHGGPGGPGRSDPRQRRRHRGLKIALVVVLILFLGILGSAYLLWNSMMNQVNIVSPTDATLPSEYNVPTESLANPVPEEKGIINVLLLGADAREEDVIQTNTDSMMILTIDQGTRKIKITSLQRDMLVWMPGRTEPAKLNAANAYGGPSLAMRVVNDTFRLNIENYVIVNMRGMEALVDIAGGVSVNVEKDEIYYTNQMIGYQNSIYPETPASKFLTKSGMQMLNGRQAVAFGRIRKGDSDYARMGRQRVVIQALFDRFMQAGIGTKASMMSKGLSYITTNFSKTQLTSFGLSTLPLMSGTMEQLQIPITGYFVEDPEPVWVNRCDFNGMIPLLQKFIFGRTYPFDPVKKIPGAPNSGTKVTTATTKATTKAPTTTAPTTTAATTRPTTESTATKHTTDATTSRQTTDPAVTSTTDGTKPNQTAKPTTTAAPTTTQSGAGTGAASPPPAATLPLLPVVPYAYPYAGSRALVPVMV